MNNTIPKVAYTSFGKTKAVPRKIYVGRKHNPECTEYEKTLWVEREEDWYGLSMAPTLVVTREDWISAEECEPDSECARKYKRDYLRTKRLLEEEKEKSNQLAQQVKILELQAEMKDDVYSTVLRNIHHAK